jgi:hypothetical protein
VGVAVGGVDEVDPGVQRLVDDLDRGRYSMKDLLC